MKRCRFWKRRKFCSFVAAIFLLRIGSIVSDHLYKMAFSNQISLFAIEK